MSRNTQQAAPFLGIDPHRAGLPPALCDDIILIDRLLGEVLEQQENGRVVAIARRLYREREADPRALLDRIPELGDPRVAQRIVRAFTIFFQLINAAEQKEIVRANREREAKAARGARSESIAEAVERLAAAGVSADEMQALIDRLDISPTLTAHPTEARRRSVQDKLQVITEALIERAKPAGAPRFDAPLNVSDWTDQTLRRALTALWQTDEVRTTALTVTDEATNAMYFLERSIFDLVAWLHDDLRSALERAFPGETFRIGAFVTYRSWVGGDRDGNPNVTPDLTWNTLRRLKTRVLEIYLDRLEALRRELTQSSRLVSASDALLQSLEADRARVKLGKEQLQRYRVEPYALKLVYAEARLRATRSAVAALDDFRGVESAGASSDGAAYGDASELLRDLELLQQSLRANRARVVADSGPLAHLVAQVRSFGFHFVTLDVRQHSDEHAQALEEMLAAAGVLPSDVPYTSLSEPDKVALLARELANPRPLLPHDRAAGDKAGGVLEVFEVIRRAQRHLSREAVTTYVISMTHGVSDMLEVLLLAKETGLDAIDVVPLFETIDDLARCDGLMRELFADPVYRKHLASRGEFQEIMLGYSDSSKDGGFLAANATLYDAQARLARACAEAGVAVRFFHGRGGTVGRGGGRANRAIGSQPPGSFSGRIRFTEQGEVISFRYAVPPIGHRHMEQIVSASLLASSDRTAPASLRREWRSALDDMAGRSLAVYRELVHDDPDFWSFYTQATPIRYISRLPIASRPASRSKGLSGIDALRAIPWVFAWVQSRYVLPGWYGLGTALEAYAGEDAAKLELLREMYRDWLFFRMVINNAQLELLRAHLQTAAWYAARVQPPELGARIHGRIAEEHALSRAWILRITGNPDLLEHAPVVRRTVELRNPALEPLSKLQVALLDRLDTDAADAGQEAPWQEAMLLSITGIAAAMQSTG